MGNRTVKLPEQPDSTLDAICEQLALEVRATGLSQVHAAVHRIEACLPPGYYDAWRERCNAAAERALNERGQREGHEEKDEGV